MFNKAKMQTMQCREIRKLMPFYPEMIREPKKLLEITGHLESCRECADLRQRYEQILQQTPHIQVREPDPFFFTRLEAKLEKQEDFGFSWILQVRPVLMGLSLAIPLALGIWLGISWNQRSGAQTTEMVSQVTEVNKMLSIPGYQADTELYFAETLSE